MYARVQRVVSVPEVVERMAERRVRIRSRVESFCCRDWKRWDWPGGGAMFYVFLFLEYELFPDVMLILRSLKKSCWRLGSLFVMLVR